jgi:signal peptidase I
VTPTARELGAADGPAARRSALRPRASDARSVLEALAWLYLYSVLWLTAYAVLTVLAFGWSPVVITGGSMRPHIAAGDLVMVAPVEQQIGKGTVVTYRQPGRDRLVTHRVTEVLPEGYRTRGDANAVEDSDVVAPAQVKGAGRLLIPFLGRPFVWLREGAFVPFGAWAVLSCSAMAVAVRRRPEEPRVDGAAVRPRPPVPRPRTAVDVLPRRPRRALRPGLAHG